VLNLVPNST